MPYRDLIETMFKIVNREGKTVPFILKPQQRLLDREFSRRNIIPKGRQGAGISTYHIARYVAKCLSEENRRCVIISHETDSTARLLDRARFILRHLSRPSGQKIDADIERDSLKAITFPKTGSSLWIGTAGSRNFGRGDTITDLLLSEAAQYDHAESLIAGLLPAAEHGEVSVESTGNGTGNWYHRQCLRAREGRGFRLFFFPSHEMADNRIPLGEDALVEFLTHLNPELEEPEMLEAGFSAEFLAWRRERIEIDFDGELRTFRQEHPVSFNDCFQSTGYSFFQRVRYEPTGEWRRESRDLWVLGGHPNHSCKYVIGADVGAGVGRDNSVAEVLALPDLHQVGEWASAGREPDEFGDVLFDLGKRFNWAYINVERNNHGLTTLKQLLGGYPLNLLHRGNTSPGGTQTMLSRLGMYGTQVTEGNRGLLIAAARRAAATACIRSEMLESEMGSFAEQANGKIEANPGCHDDRVMAYAHACVCVERAAIATSEDAPLNDDLPPDPFSWEGIFGQQPAPVGVLPINRERYG